MGRLAVADERCDLADRKRRLPGEQLGRRLHAAGPEILAEGRAAEQRICTLDLAWGARQHRRELAERQRAAVARGDDLLRLQIQAPPGGFGADPHPHRSDARART
jgi:hypothetical protein